MAMASSTGSFGGFPGSSNNSSNSNSHSSCLHRREWRPLSSNMFFSSYYVFLFLYFSSYLVTLVNGQSYKVRAYPESALGWKSLSTKQGKFTNRNAHASCVFNGRIWLVGGRTQVYNKYNLLPTFRVGDVWSSQDGANWRQELDLEGDFFAQNEDVTMPGPITPFYERYGHTLDAINSKGKAGYGQPKYDLMILTGGYSPDPSNDVWISDTGKTWSFVDQPPPWTARAWHRTAIYQGKLWLMGGSPLTNDVWMLNSIVKVNRSDTGFDPLTRAMYMSYTYELNWVSIGDAPWEPRVAFGLVSQWYFNETNQIVDDATERIMLVAGYGGFPVENKGYTGIHCYSDSWSYDNATGWTRLSEDIGIGDRAFFSMNVMHDTDARYNLVQTVNISSPRIYLFGGGNVGNTTQSSRRYTSMQGYGDAWWTRDGSVWYQVNFESGGDYQYGMNFQPQYTSEEWAKTTVNSQLIYLGLWGHTMENFNATLKEEVGGGWGWEVGGG